MGDIEEGWRSWLGAGGAGGEHGLVLRDDRFAIPQDEA